MIHQVSVANTPKTHSFNLIWTLIFVIGSLALFIGITNNTLWYDEAFTGALVRHSFVDVVEITAETNTRPSISFSASLSPLYWEITSFLFAPPRCLAL